MKHFGFNTDDYFRDLDMTLDVVYRDVIGNYFMEREGCMLSLIRVNSIMEPKYDYE